MSEMHLVNLKDASLVSRGRLRLADLLKSTKDQVGDQGIENHPRQIAEFNGRSLEIAAATSRPATIVKSSVHAAPVYVRKEE